MKQHCLPLEDIHPYRIWEPEFSGEAATRTKWVLPYPQRTQVLSTHACLIKIWELGSPTKYILIRPAWVNFIQLGPLVEWNSNKIKYSSNKEEVDYVHTLFYLLDYVSSRKICLCELGTNVYFVDFTYTYSSFRRDVVECFQVLRCYCWMESFKCNTSVLENLAQEVK